MKQAAEDKAQELRDQAAGMFGSATNKASAMWGKVGSMGYAGGEQ